MYHPYSIQLAAAAAILSATTATAQLTLAPLGSFTHSVFAGNGTIGVCMDSFTTNIWVVDFSNAINLHRFDLTGSLLSSHATTGCTPAMTSPNDLTQDRNSGDLWLVDNDSPGKVTRFSTSGSCLPGGFTLGSAYSNPVSMVHHPFSGTLFIGHTGAVAEWTTAGSNLGTGFPVGTPLGPGSIISGLTFVPGTGRFLAASSGSIIYEISAAGTVLGSTSLTSFGITGIQAVDYDPVSGILLVADNNNVTIHLFSDTGAGNVFQTNQPRASLAINGIQGTVLTPATVTLGLGQFGVLSGSSTSIGAAWELIIGTSPLVTANQGALTTADGQVLNIDPFDPTIVFLWGLFQSPPFAGFSSALSFPSPVMFSTQMAVADATSPAGMRLSQPIRLIVQ